MIYLGSKAIASISVIAIIGVGSVVAYSFSSKENKKSVPSFTASVEQSSVQKNDAKAVKKPVVLDNKSENSTFVAGNFKLKEVAIDDSKFRLEKTNASEQVAKTVAATSGKNGWIGVMVENTPESRNQQVGLSTAKVVYEAVTEGGITRYLAVFDANDVPEKVGPVRSARPFFVEMAKAWNPLYIHAGGSAEALDSLSEIGTLGIKDANLISSAYSLSIRDNKYPAPHNLFVSPEKAVAKFGTIKTDAPVDFSNAFEGNKTAKTVNVKFSGPDYAVKWKFENGSYARYVAGIRHKDVIANTIVVLASTHTQEGKYVRIQSEGSGKAILFRDGKALEAKWSGKNGNLSFTDAKTGDSVGLGNGKVWIESVATTEEAKFE